MPMLVPQTLINSEFEHLHRARSDKPVETLIGKNDEMPLGFDQSLFEYPFVEARGFHGQEANWPNWDPIWPLFGLIWNLAYGIP